MAKWEANRNLFLWIKWQLGTSNCLTPVRGEQAKDTTRRCEWVLRQRVAAVSWLLKSVGEGVSGLEHLSSRLCTEGRKELTDDGTRYTHNRNSPLFERPDLTLQGSGIETARGAAHTSCWSTVTAYDPRM